jgi:hypothetical protein
MKLIWCAGERSSSSSLLLLTLHYLIDESQTMPGFVSMLSNGALACIAGFFLYAFAVFAQRWCVFVELEHILPIQLRGMVLERRLFCPDILAACCRQCHSSIHAVLFMALLVFSFLRLYILPPLPKRNQV